MKDNKKGQRIIVYRSFGQYFGGLGAWQGILLIYQEFLYDLLSFCIFVIFVQTWYGDRLHNSSIRLVNPHLILIHLLPLHPILLRIMNLPLQLRPQIKFQHLPLIIFLLIFLSQLLLNEYNLIIIIFYSPQQMLLFSQLLFDETISIEFGGLIYLVLDLLATSSLCLLFVGVWGLQFFEEGLFCLLGFVVDCFYGVKDFRVLGISEFYLVQVLRQVMGYIESLMLSLRLYLFSQLLKSFILKPLQILLASCIINLILIKLSQFLPLPLLLQTFLFSLKILLSLYPAKPLPHSLFPLLLLNNLSTLAMDGRAIIIIGILFDQGIEPL